MARGEFSSCFEFIIIFINIVQIYFKFFVKIKKRVVLCVSPDARKLDANYINPESGKFDSSQGIIREFCFNEIVDTLL